MVSSRPRRPQVEWSSGRSRRRDFKRRASDVTVVPLPRPAICAGPPVRVRCRLDVAVRTQEDLPGRFFLTLPNGVVGDPGGAPEVVHEAMLLGLAFLRTRS